VTVNASLTADLLPSVGNTLNAGDLALIVAATQLTTAPEPGASLLCGTAAVFLFYIRKKRGRSI